MPIFTYRGIDKTGKEIKANINSDSESQAKQKIRTTGVMLISIKEHSSGSAKKQSSMSFGSPINISELSLMTRQLATLVKAKIQIVESLNALMDQASNPQLKVVLSEIRQKVNEGSSLANAFSDYPKIFNNVYVNMVEAGEMSGNLSIVLLRLAEFTEAQVKLKNKIKGAMTYPIIMVVVGVAMMSIIFTFVIPKITKIFITMKKELPLATKISIWMSNFFLDYWWMLIIGSFLSIILFRKYIRGEKGKARWHRFLLKAPVVGNLSIMINVSRFCSTLATLLNSGVPILVSMRIVKNLVTNVHMQNAVEESKVSIAEGGSMAGPLAKSTLFPSMVTHMIALGEKSGEIEPMLRIISENYEDQVEAKLDGLTSILEPIMIVVMGFVVAFIVISVVMPMMDINTLGK